MNKLLMGILGVVVVGSLSLNFHQYNENKVLTTKLESCYNELWSSKVKLGGTLYELEQVKVDYFNTNEKYIQLKESISDIEVKVLEATAYTHTGNPTKTGVMPSRGMVAVDPKVIPLGSKVYVEGYGWAVATDTGGDIKGNRIDLFMETESECWDFGRKDLKIIIQK